MLCPKAYLFRYLSDFPQVTDLPRTLGTAVHSFVAGLHRQYTGERDFFYKSSDRARGAWFGFWSRTVNKEKPRLKDYSESGASKYGGIGWNCIRNYWNGASSKGNPLAIERRLEWSMSPGVKLVGVLDQIRELQLDNIKKKWPELVNNEVIDSRYLPYLIGDLKTGRTGLDLHPDATELEKALQQIGFHGGMQGALYTHLFIKNLGKRPVGFFLWDLREGRIFTTVYTQRDIDISLALVEKVVYGVNAEDFPEKPGVHCRWCDYVKYCRDLKWSVPATELPGGSVYRAMMSSKTEMKPPKQLALPGFKGLVSRRRLRKKGEAK